MNKQMDFSIVIPTYNRSNLLKRAINSILNQTYNNGKIEIIIIDNNSEDDTRDMIEKYYSDIKYLCNKENRGPGYARNRGLVNSSYNWVLMLDDDDELVNGALNMIYDKLNSINNLDKYPVYNFACSNGFILKDFMILNFSDYVNNVIKGDFTPIFNKKMILSENLKYPDTIVGGESFLWYKIAYKYGIPTWSNVVCLLHDDAPIRLTRKESQIKFAHEHALLQEQYMKEFTELYKKYNINELNKRKFAASVYWLLANERKKARKYMLDNIKNRNNIILSFFLIIISYFPLRMVKSLYKLFR
ncbi:glycosyltransferase family A protein [Thermoanaerobacterium thermosaccharolyticum]|uniref:glycosyltransferase family 2 protein n=1 Tax=Thermoanaerobacterium thermosaccharolyticum TaxID=1517 RepID=UPI003DA86B9B